MTVRYEKVTLKKDTLSIKAQFSMLMKQKPVTCLNLFKFEDENI